MIEDLQDEYTLYTETGKQTSRKGSVFLIMLSIWIIFCAVLFFIFRPSIRRSLEQTNAVEIVENIGKYRFLVESEELTLYFYNNKTGLTPYKVKVKNTGSSSYHNAIEGLLAGPGPQVLENGGVSFLKSGTGLLGMTVSEKTAFINFSQEIATEEDCKTASDQILLTLKAINPYIEETVILVNGIDTTH